MNSGSKFWTNLPISKKKMHDEGIISTEKPFDLEKDPNYSIVTNEEISKEELMFVLENGFGSSGNSMLIDPKLSSCSIVVKIQDESKKIYGFCISIKCSLYLQLENDFEIIESGMTSHLCIDKDHRSKSLASYVIYGIIDEGFKNKIYTGYHYIDNPKSASNLKVFNYYRPLNIKKSLENGYQINSLSKQNLSFYMDEMPTEKQMQLLERDYSVSSYESYSVNPSVYEDLHFLQTHNRKLTLIFSVVQFEELKKNFQFFTVKKGEEIIGLVIYKTLLVHIGKLGKVSPNAQICLLEMNPEYSHVVVSKVIYHLTEHKFVTMTGVCFGEMSNEKLRKKFGFVTSGFQYLDFYNVHVKLKDANDVNLLYY
jgi:hypothetical protein